MICRIEAVALISFWLAGCGGSAESDGNGAGGAAGSVSNALPSSGCAMPSVTEGDQVIRVSHGGVEREYTLHVPPDLGDDPVKLVLNFHGLTSSMDRQMSYTDMNVNADAGGFLVAYPNGLTNPDTTIQSWNAGSCCAFGDEGRNDVGFARAVVADIGSRACVDERRVFATGLSNGGYMSYRLACEAADVFAAIAPVAGGMGNLTCNPSRPVPVIALHGTADTLAPYEGSDLVGSSIPDTLAAWAERNGCTEGPTESFRNGTAHCDTWSACDEGAKVTLCTIDGMGHCWPGTTSCLFGSSTTDIAANTAMLEFFEPFTLP